MNKIKVNVKQTHRWCEFYYRGKTIAHIRKCIDGSIYVNFQDCLYNQNFRTFADAVEFITDLICEFFAKFGLEVEFTED